MPGDITYSQHILKFYHMENPNSSSKLSISKNDEGMVEIFLEKLEILKAERKDDLVLITRDELEKMLNEEEKIFMDRVLDINPKEFGILTLPLKNNYPREKMTAIRGQKYTWKEKEIEIPTQYLPQKTYKAYMKMNKNLKKDTGRGVLIKSGYRSEAYQLLTFLYWLSKNKFDLALTLRGVALPRYSEHGYPPKQGMDFVTEDGISQGNEICFDETKEYKWLLKNGERFGFYLSYPKNNPFGMIFEPWHWHYE